MYLFQPLPKAKQIDCQRWPYLKISTLLDKDIEIPQPKILPSHTADNFDWQIMNVESRVSAISIIIMQTHLSTTHHIKADLI